MNGYVRTVLGDKKYGFIRVPDGHEYFFHKEDYLDDWDELVEGCLKSQMNVEFEAIQTPKGPRARNVMLEKSDG